MNCRTSFRLLVLLVTAAWLADLTARAAERKPNVIHIVSDELGYYELSCLGNPHLQTANIDRMAAEGVRFTQALAGSALCAPTRCCLMTGKHSGHTAARRRGNHRVVAEAGWLRHGRLRQVGRGRTRLDWRAGEARI